MRALVFLACLAGSAAAQTAQPYAGQEGREIASISPERIAGLRAGEGLGYAKAAEFNGWPGPAHVLELADDLGLDAATRTEVEAIRQAMLDEAIPLGEALIVAEADLDALFHAAPDRAAIETATARAAGIEAKLRAAHLAAHLATSALLSRHQKMLYARARGYGGGHMDHSGHAAH